MKQLYITLIALFIFPTVFAQITITGSDMPVANDTLRYSFALPTGATISPADSGANVVWSYSLAPTRQAVDTYKTAASVNILYALTVGTTASGYKVADSFPGLGAFLPVSIQQLYTFFENKTSVPLRYQAQAFAASISGLPTAIPYTNPDVWYFFPLNYALNRTDSAHYKLNITLPGFGGLKETGYRKTRVDGWGTITTPYYTTPVSCIRVRSEIHEIDSLTITGLPSFGFPRNTVEYKWLVNGDHYPALWVTSLLTPGGTETVSTIRYRDSYRDTAAVSRVAAVNNTMLQIEAYPNPAANGKIIFDIPADWQNFVVEIYDMSSKQVASYRDEREIDMVTLAAGTYIARIVSGSNTGFVKFIK